MSTKSIGILLTILAIGSGIFGGITFFDNVVAENNQKLENIKNENIQLNSEIDSIGNTTSKELTERLSFFEDYFSKKSEMYILEIFGLIEYSLPDNNFIDSLSIDRQEKDLSLTFSSPDVEDLLKLYRNLQKVKELGIITNYTLEEIKLEGEEGLKSTEMKKYSLEIGLSPNVTGGNEQIIEFLKKYDSYYRNIYEGTLKKVYCDLYTTESGQQVCKTEKQIKEEKEGDETIVSKLEEEKKKGTLEKNKSNTTGKISSKNKNK